MTQAGPGAGSGAGPGAEVGEALAPAPLVHHPAQDAPSSRLAVDFARATGAVHGGAGGMLYGLADPGVPAQPLLAGARPRTAAQKAHGGAQHPGGDAGEVAGALLAAGGSEVLVYLQDDYAQWPYEFDGIEDYLRRVRRVVAQAVAGPHRASFAWVPFNEPDWIWYPDWPADRERFCRDWVTVVRAIRELDPTARIVGPNEAEFHPDRLTDVLRSAAAHGVLPDVVSWHELGPSSLGSYREHHRRYRQIEAELGITPREVSIDEYGNRRDMGNPGQLVQWLAMFEDTKVDADLAYWTMAGTLDDHTAGAAGANGGWWALAWYARLRGTTVAVDPPFPDVPDTAQGIAAVDPRHGTATVVVGGGRGDLEVELRGLDALRGQLGAADGDLVVEVERVAWTGQSGDSGPPVLLSSDVLPAGDATVLALRGGDPTAAHRLVLVPGRPRAVAPERERWSVSTEAEDAAPRGGRTEVHGHDAQRCTASGGADVVGFEAGGGLEWTTVVPEAGAHVLTLLYATPGTPAQLRLTVDDGAPAELHLGPALDLQHRGAHRHRLDLPAGEHRFRLVAEQAVRVSLDRVDLARATSPQQHLRATDSMTSGDVTARDGLLVLGPGARADVWVHAATSSYHDVHLDGPGAARAAALAVDGHPLPRRGGAAPTSTVFLAEGVHVLSVTVAAGAGEPVRLAGVRVAVRPDLDDAVLRVTGRHLAADPAAAAVGAVALGRGEGLQEEVLVERAGVGAGDVVVVVEYANGLRSSGHSYNTDAITVFAEIAEDSPDAAPAVRCPFPFSHGWSASWQQSRVVRLRTERSPLSVRAVADTGPLVRAVRVAPLVADRA